MDDKYKKGDPGGPVLLGTVTVTVTAPPSGGATVAPGANLSVIASGSSTSGIITGWAVFLDSLQLYNLSQTATSGPIAQSLNLSLAISSSTALGAHTLQVKAYDASGASGITSRTVTVATPPAGTITLTVTQPHNADSFSNFGTIQVVANATTTATGITAWEVWYGNVRLFHAGGGIIPSINTMVTVPAGTAVGAKTMLVKCWDNTGTLKQTSLTISVPPGSITVGFAPGLPSSPKLVSSFQTHNPSMAPNYNAALAPTLFTGSTNHDGVTSAVNPALVDDSENAAAPMVISKETIHDLLPLNSDGSSTYPCRIGMHLQAWWGLGTHPNIGMSDLNASDVARQVQDIKDRGYDLLIIDWYSQTSPNVANDAIVDLFVTACNSIGLNFCLMIDQQYFGVNGFTAATYESGLITAINHLMDRYAGNSKYERYTFNGVSRPLILLWGIASLVGTNVNWTNVRNGVSSHANPLLIQYQASGFSVVESDGSLAWLDDNADNTGGNPPSGSSYLTNSFFPACTSHQSLICISSAWHGFNGTLTRSAGWSLGKYIAQRAGQSWLDVWTTNFNYLSSGKRLDYVCVITGDDFQEGTGVLAGTRTDVTVNLAISGNVLAFSTTGNENTVRRYNLWGSTDGVNATLLATQLPGSGNQFDLTALPGLTANGTYTLYLEAQGMPSLQNHMAPQNPVRSFGLTVVPPTAILTVDAASGPAPFLVTFDASLSFDQNQPITNYAFDFGDGSTPKSGVDVGATHTYQPGTYVATLTVTDLVGSVGTAQVQISAFVPPPTTDPTTPILNAPLFPTLTMPTGSYTWPISKYAEYSSIVLATASLRAELAKAQALYPIWHFELDVALLTGDISNRNSAVAALLGFHMQVFGRQQTWLFNDPYDNQTGGIVQFATGDNLSTAFQLTRPVAGGTDIVQNLNGTPQIYVNNILQGSGAYTVSQLGVVTFTTPPAAGAPISWSGNFLFRCRFDDDMLEELRQLAPSTWDIQKVAFHSVIL